MAALDVAGLPALLDLSAFDHVDGSTVEVALTEFGRFAATAVAPTDQIGDIKGTVLDPVSGSVAVPEEFYKAYRGLVDGGWNGLTFPTEWGGGGFPTLVGMALQEMLASANVSLSLNPLLTQSAIELLLVAGTEGQKARFLPRLITGEWSGTMVLTESAAGSDLGEIRTLARPDGDRWLLTGTKIFITWGQHDLTDNIVHLVLARTPDAPPGTGGLSIFLTPSRLVADDGTLGDRNSISCVRVEEKLGLHASPTCVLEFDGARAELVGPLHGGMRAMFTMMNIARLSIGMQGPAIGEVAYQQALDYAHARRQGTAAGTDRGRSPIVEHPDVRRMLLTMRVLTVASRMVVYAATGYRDLARHAGDAAVRTRAQEYVDLLTPVAKAWATDAGVEIASLGIQVFGGSGYMEETGIAQRWRDSRIAPIYEGTNGIQAIDLVTRKVPRQQGAWMRELIDEMAETLTSHRGEQDLAESLEILAEALGIVRTATDWMLDRVVAERTDALAGASSYLELLGVTLGGWLMLRRTVLTRGTDLAAASVAENRFYATEILSRAPGLIRPITAGARRMSGLLQPPGD
jgi:alkylation response protein AidB-like acyl-CoA dehydrogenase